MNMRSLPVLRWHKSIILETLSSKMKYNVVQKVLTSFGKKLPDYTASQARYLLLLFTGVKISDFNYMSSLILDLDLWGT